MGLEAVTTAIDTLLTSEAPFVADITALIGTAPTGVLRANTPWEQVNARQLPCFVLEQGDGQSGSNSNDGGDGLMIGHQQQQLNSQLLIALLWSEQDRDTAGRQRTALPGIFARLFMRNPMPGGAAGAWLEHWQSDRGIRHPRHQFVAAIHIEYTEALS